MRHSCNIAAIFLNLLICIAAPATVFAQPTVTLTLEDGSADEASLGTGSFRVTRTNDGNTAQSLHVLVALEAASTATTPADFTASPWVIIELPNIYRVTILANELSQLVTITPVKDNLIEGLEDIQLTLQPSVNYIVGADTQAQITISDDVAQVNLTLNDGDAAEADLDSGSFTVTRSSNGKLDQLLHVLVALEGASTAMTPADFTASPWVIIGLPNIYRVTIPANELSQVVTITPVKDNLIEGVEDIQLTLQPDGSTYTVGGDTQAQITISDDVAQVNLTLNDGDAAEAGPDTGSFTVTRSSNGKLDQLLYVLVALEAASTATIGADFTASPWVIIAFPNIYRVTIPANELSQLVTITPELDANEEEGDETVVLTLQGDGTTYTVGASISAIITIEDFVNLLFKDGFESPVP